MDTNLKVLKLINERLDLGQRKYKGSIPIKGEGGRDNLKESLEEALDMCVYLSATILELIEERDEKRNSKR
tara:strand:+ start:39472 stop:39684 length:213 start_codon:yes stop_codon:yes gene_type:complete